MKNNTQISTPQQEIKAEKIDIWSFMQQRIAMMFSDCTWQVEIKI